LGKHPLSEFRFADGRSLEQLEADRKRYYPDND
jgi:hypothetical protein